MASSNLTTQSMLETSKGIRKTIKTELGCQSLQGCQLTYGYVQKKNNTGIFHNQRFIIICSPAYIGYLNQLDQKVVLPFRSISQIPKPKKQFKIQQITQCIQKETNVELKFKFRQKEKEQLEEWILRTPNETFAKKLLTRIKEAQDYEARKLEEAEKQRLLKKPIPKLPQSKKEPISSKQPQQSPRTKRLKIEKIFNEQLQKERQKIEDKKKKREKLKKQLISEWNYRLFKEKPQEVIAQFKSTCENLMKDIIDDLYFDVKERKYKADKENQYSAYYRINKIQITLCYSTLRIDQDGQRIYDEYSKKMVNKQFKNLNYIFERSSEIQNIKVPLAMIVEYKGIVGLFKAIVLDSGQEIDIEAIMQQLQKLSLKTRIDKSVYRDGSIDFVKLDSKRYCQFLIAEQQYEQAKLENLNMFYIENMNNYLPNDMHNGVEINTKILRKQFIQKTMFAGDEFCGKDLSGILQQNPKSIQIKHAESRSSILDSQVKQAVSKLQSMDEFIMSSQQLAQYCHQRGINMRYLGTMHSICTKSFLKQILTSEIVARVIKIILRNNLQQCIKTYNSSIKRQVKNRYEYIKAADSYLKDMVVDILNSIFVKSEDSQMMWLLINIQAKALFGVQIDQKDILPGYLTQAISFHCKLKFNYEMINQSVLFQENQYFNRQSLIDFETECKWYDCTSTQLYNELLQLLLSEEGFQSIVKQYNLQQQPIPKVFQIYKLGTLLKECVSKYTASQEELVHLNIYKYAEIEPINTSKLHILLHRLNKLVALGQKDRILVCFSELLSRIHRWCGDYHPSLHLVYDKILQYYQTLAQFESCIALAKTNLMNCLYLVGNESPKCHPYYEKLGDLYMKSAKKEESLNYFRKGKHNLEINDLTDTPAYASLCLKLSFLHLNSNKYEEVIELILKAIEIYQKKFQNDAQFQKQLVESYQILALCYKATNKAYQQNELSEYCSEMLPQINDPVCLQRLIKICLTPKIATCQSQHILVNIIENLQIIQPQQQYLAGLMFIKKKVKQGNFIERFGVLLGKIEKMEKYYDLNKTIKNWKGMNLENINSDELQFLAITEALIYLLGEQFILENLSLG